MDGGGEEGRRMSKNGGEEGWRREMIERMRRERIREDRWREGVE